MASVEAARTLDQLKRIELALSTRTTPLYRDLWVIGINVALRISDLLSIKYSDIQDGRLKVREQKTGKVRDILLNERAVQVIERRRKDHPEHVYLFESDANRANRGTPVSRQIVGRVFRETGQRPDIKLNLGTHSLRKTRARIMFESGIRIEEICKMLNHSSPVVTMTYLNIVQKDMDDLATKFVL